MMYCLCGFALMVYANVPSACHCLIRLAQRAAVVLRVGVGAEGEMLRVFLNWSQLFLWLGTINWLSGLCKEGVDMPINRIKWDVHRLLLERC